jgi:hypothetical protein
LHLVGFTLEINYSKVSNWCMNFEHKDSNGDTDVC